MHGRHCPCETAKKTNATLNTKKMASFMAPSNAKQDTRPYTRPYTDASHSILKCMLSSEEAHYMHTGLVWYTRPVSKPRSQRSRGHRPPERAVDRLTDKEIGDDY